MSSIDRPLSGSVLRFSLADERARVNDPELLARNGRIARTLVKEGRLRVTLVMVAAGGRIAPHHAEGPITVQMVDGAIQFRAAGKEHALVPGDLLVVDAGVEHAVESDAGERFC